MPAEASFILDCNKDANTVDLKAAHSDNSVVGSIAI
jgi:hypothetical protein